MDRRYYLLKAGLLVLALMTVGFNSGRYTREMAGEISQAHASTLTFMQVAMADVRCTALTALDRAAHIFG
ncbi:MAG TPA: hypothetical protein VH000_13680 [Rhizomicrobium sp.]|nr:hypothetical protein [Rhizomicrobium sp.]HEX4535279.1 hypothetical protein [Rhizomicrobium sp.]